MRLIRRHYFRAGRTVQILGEVVSAAGKTQLRIAETEKYPHVTYFFNGGVEVPFPGEDRKIIPSPKVATYDLQAGNERAGSHGRGAGANGRITT